MASDNAIVIVGNLTDDPEMRFTSTGAAVASFTVAVNRRVRDQASGEWKDGDASFFRCNVWRQQAENVTDSLHKGTRVIVNGQLRQRHWEVEGQKRSTIEIEVDDVGPALRWATAKVTKSGRSDAAPAPAGVAAATTSDAGQTPPDDEPPF